MLCNICHKNSASVHLTEIINHRVTEMHICKSCAKLKTEQTNEQVDFSDFLGSLASMQNLGPQQVLKCPSCGLTFAEFQKKGRLGCAKCYLIFKAQILPLLKKIHRLTHHTGKIPFSLKKKVTINKSSLEELNLCLKEAIKLEDYEQAAKLRDEIKKINI